MDSRPLSKSIEVRRYDINGESTAKADAVCLEQPLEIRIRGTSVAITMRTPGHDRELAVGFAVAEGLIQAPSQLVEVAHCRQAEAEHPENIINLFLAADAPCDLTQLSRHVYASSSCGICGKASIEAVEKNWPPIQSDFTIAARTLVQLPDKLREKQATFETTGGLHAAALVDASGQLLCVSEDVGRHNAVDKVIGWSWLTGGFPPADTLLLVSGRSSFEILQKALAARIPFVAGVSAPSSLAVDLAETNHQTLVGFLREHSFNCYTNAQRIRH